MHSYLRLCSNKTNRNKIIFEDERTYLSTYTFIYKIIARIYTTACLFDLFFFARRYERLFADIRSCHNIIEVIRMPLKSFLQKKVDDVTGFQHRNDYWLNLYHDCIFFNTRGSTSNTNLV